MTVDTPLAVGCIYGQFSSLEGMSIDTIRYVVKNADRNPPKLPPRGKIPCPECGQVCGKGAGLTAHIRNRHKTAVEKKS